MNYIRLAMFLYFIAFLVGYFARILYAPMQFLKKSIKSVNILALHKSVLDSYRITLDTTFGIFDIASSFGLSPYSKRIIRQI